MIASAEKTKESVRRLAAEILLKVEIRKAYADILLDRTLRTAELDERDRALLTELTYGTLRWRGTIDDRLSRHLRRPLAQTDALIRNLLRLTGYQLLYLDRIPGYAAVNEAVELAKRHRGQRAAGFVNAVLRSLIGEARENIANASDMSAASLAVRYSHPEWLVQRWLDEFGPDQAQALMRANNEKTPVTLRVNSLKCTRDDLSDRLLRDGIQATPTPWSPQGVLLPSAGAVENLPGFGEGLFQIQGEASQLVSYLLSPLAGERILDACAAPGGKTTHIAELMKDSGELVALDTSARGIEKIRQNMQRLGLNSVRVLRADAGEQFAESIAGPYDRLLVDAPCSGLGTLRAHPEIKWHRDENDIRRLSALQLKILHRVAGYLKAGGILVYSTCTLTRDENEQTVNNFLAAHPEFELQDGARYLPQQARHMVMREYFQALPQRDNTDGFFAARLRKVS
ncbi:MAG: 16S rRNA (cytosine(967)-C(5))-methyltransferase RsmB [Candidatus Binatia bacterium]